MPRSPGTNPARGVGPCRDHVRRLRAHPGVLGKPGGRPASVCQASRHHLCSAFAQSAAALLIDRLQAPDLPPLPPPSAVHPVVGEHGSGKTTSAAKLAAYRARGCWQEQNPSVRKPDRSSSCGQPGSAFRSSRWPREATRAAQCSALSRPPSPPSRPLPLWMPCPREAWAFFRPGVSFPGLKGGAR